MFQSQGQTKVTFEYLLPHYFRTGWRTLTKSYINILYQS